MTVTCFQLEKASIIQDLLVVAFMTKTSPKPYQDPATDAALLLIRIGIGLLVVVLPLWAVFSRRPVFILTPIAAAIVLGAAALVSRGEGIRSLKQGVFSPTGMAAAFLAIWAGLSLAWTPFFPEASERFIKSLGTTCLIAITASFLPSRTKPSTLYMLPAGVFLTAIAVFFSAIFGPSSLRTGAEGDPSTLERATIGLIVIAWPALAALAARARWILACILAAAIWAATIVVWTSIGLAALIAGALIYAMAVSSPERIGRITGIFFALLFLAAPALPFVLSLLPHFANSGEEGISGTILAWMDIVRRDGMHTILGHGLDMATRGISAGYLPAKTPRSLLFELWFELGIIGAVGSAWLSYRACVAAGQLFAPVAPFMLAGLASGLTIAILGLSTAQLWWLTWLGVVCIAYALVCKGQYSTKRPHALTTAKIREQETVSSN